MPTLDWIGKQAVVKHHKDVPYLLLESVPELSQDGRLSMSTMCHLESLLILVFGCISLLAKSLHTFLNQSVLQSCIFNWSSKQRIQAVQL